MSEVNDRIVLDVPLTEDERRFLLRLVNQEIRKVERDRERYIAKHGKPFEPEEGKKDITIYKMECAMALVRKLDEKSEGE